MRFGKTLTVYTLGLGLVFALSAWAQQKPLTQDQVLGLVRSGLGDETGGKLIGQRGISFTPSEDFLESLRSTGASEAFLAAVRTAKQPEPASGKKPLNQEQIFALLVNQVPSHRVTILVQERGIDFDPTADYLQEVRLAGGEDELINALKSANVTKSVAIDSAAQAREAEVRQHVARGAEYFQRHQYPQAEQEYRAALLLTSENADLYVSLAYILDQQNKWDEAAVAAREALRLNPNNAFAHSILGLALEKKGDRKGALAEYGTAYTLDPNNPQFKQAYDRLSQPLATPGQAKATASASCVILKRLGPAGEVTSHLYSRGKQYQFVEGDFPKGVKWLGRLSDNDIRDIQDNGGKFVILELKYTEADLVAARKTCKQ
jgi:tetratricopeptide (TPR) repeat protein